MSNMGVTLFDGNNKINIRLYGNFFECPIDHKELKDCAEVMWNGILNGQFDRNKLPIYTTELADQLCEIFCDGKTIIWLSVEYLMITSGYTYGANSEKVLIDNVA